MGQLLPGASRRQPPPAPGSHAAHASVTSSHCRLRLLTPCAGLDQLGAALPGAAVTALTAATASGLQPTH